MTFNQLLDKYRAISFSEHDKGSRFERLMKNFLLTYPEYREKFSEVWLWNDFPFRNDFGGKDVGIDIVAKTFDGDFWAVQCKCYAESTRIDKPVVDSFLATSSKSFSGQKFSARLWISTTNNWNAEAERAILNQNPPVSRISLVDLQNAAVDWEKLDAGTFGEGAIKKFREILPHQLDAINATQNYFQSHERGKLIMSCGTGKTFTSLKIAEKFFPRGKILFLVPSIALLSQTLSEWSTFADLPLDSICVCSDETASKGRNEDSQQNIDLALPATTDVAKIVARFKQNNPKTGLKVVFSTYQSLERISEAQKVFGDDFDLLICDEAHRTTGYGEKSTEFTNVHDQNFIRGKKRLYMTATPRLYTSDAKKKAADKDLMLWSMDDSQIFGEEIFHLGFGEAVEKNLLSDYKVIVLTVSENDIPVAIQAAIAQNNQLPLDDVAKLVGCINALDKKMDNVSQILAEVDPAPMKKAVAFCSKIKTSQKIAKTFNNFNLPLKADHVDGTMPATTRDEKLSWLKNADTCRILTNVRCLSEGVDVPSLDAVLFLSSRKSKVEIVQAVGRVMRKAPDKKYGYIVIPVVVPVDKNPEEILSESADFGTVWDVLNALRAHDSRVDIFIEEIKLHNGKNGGGGLIGGNNGDEPHIIVDTPKPYQLNLKFEDLQGAIYARMVERVGNRRYWEQWAKDIAQIAERHQNKILQLVDKPEFKNFLADLRQNINPTISERDAVEMLAQHLISKPVFDALFDNYSFAKNNSVSKALQKVFELLDTDSDSEQLDKFYNSVRERCKIATTAEDKQKIIIELYDKFFKTALPMTVERLGIVYTPVEVVDFILRSVNAVLKKNFNRTLSDRNIHVLDPFTGTGTFITRLIQSGLIRQRDLLRKYQNELHANEIILLAYYIAAINIENAFHDAANLQDFFPFDGICLTDTFQMYEQDEIETLSFALEENSERVDDQKQTRIKVIVGNPPYSVGQRSANDNNQNVFYPRLEARISATYAAATDATNKNSLYDSYIKAFRWASDRIVDGGIIGFVTNAGWLDGAAMDGLRKCFAKEFSAIYVFNLRGNQRTQGDTSRREGGKIFGSGSRAPIAITILVKNPEHDGDAEIFYRDIGDYLSRDEKLKIIRNTTNVLDESFAPITPNDRGDWINQRGDTFDKFTPLAPDKKFDGATQSFFVVNSRGIVTDRDSWCYNFSRPALESNIQTTIDYYNTHEPTEIDATKIVWTRATVNNKNRGREYKFNAAQIVESMYRPFCKTNFYYDLRLNEMTYQVPKLFPTGREDNLLICLIFGDRNFSVLMTDKITDVQFQFNGQCFPLYWYEHDAQGSLFGEGYHRRDGVSDFILRRAQEIYGDVSKEDVFYYVYGFLHLPGYREKFAAELKKSLPRIFLVDDAEKFWQLSKAGRALAEIHLHYENQPPAAVTVVGTERGAFAVKKMRLSSDKTTLTYNDFITISDIPPRSFDYVVNGRSPLEWIIDRYQVKTDSASGIVNDPNAWGIEHGNPRYILDLILSAITVSLKTLDIVDNLPEVVGYALGAAKSINTA